MFKRSHVMKSCVYALMLAPGLAFAAGSGSHSHGDGEAEMHQPMQETKPNEAGHSDGDMHQHMQETTSDEAGHSEGEMLQPMQEAKPNEASHSDGDMHQHMDEANSDEAGHSDTEMLQQMQEMHKSHEHGHDFEAMEAMSDTQRGRVLDLMVEIGLAVPPMNSDNGRELFVNKGCVVCHSVNGVGGEIGPSLNAADMPNPMNTFEFAARMWRGAGAMISMQEDLFGDQVELTGQDLADLVAFAHDVEAQKELSADQIPDRFTRLIEQ